ncbi:MAG: alpha-glucosidase/alpha-galactosidase, partial [Candidatus Thermofonsia Clade 3 bacterium]
GATAVICTVGVGGRRAWEQDVFIPRRYGIYAPVGDTVGPGGSSRALRMIPAMVAIARDVLDLAPNALFFNYSNPMAPICRAIHKATGAPVVGLCHGVMETARYLARVLNAPAEQLRYIATGINHLTWFTQVWVGEEDAMPRLRAIAAERAARPPEPLPSSDSPYESPEDHP